MSATAQNGRQWLRTGKLIVAGPAPDSDPASEPGLDLSELHYDFHIRQQDAGAPNTGVFRVYNLKEATRKTIEQQSVRVVLQVGYQGSQPGIIFDGTIKQTRSGRETNVDSYIDILAAETDLPYSYAVVNTTLAPGATPQQQVDALNKAVSAYGGAIDSNTPLIGGILPRGKVLFGMAMTHLGAVAKSNGHTWAFSNGKIRLIPLTGYLPDQVVVLNSQTGLIGVPEATQDGIRAQCLINPRIHVGTRVQINNAALNQVVNKDSNIVPSYDNPFAGAYAATSADGVYRVIVQEFEGDSRGNPWYANLICLAIDPSAAPDQSVPLYP